MDIVTGTASISSAIFLPLVQQLIQQIDDVIHLDGNQQRLEEQLNRMKNLLLHINSQFQRQQREPPDSMKNCLLKMQREVGKARELIHLSQRPWLSQCIDCIILKPKVFTQIREWKTTFDELFVELRTDIQVIHDAQQIVSAATHQEAVLVQDEPDTGLVGVEINAAETRLQRWVSEGPPVRIIGVYGMGGVGKTTLLKKVYNTYVQVCHNFDHVIWVTVAQFPIVQMQNDIASTINLDLANSSADMRKMKLCAYMKTKKFFLVLDDMWSTLNLKELGVEFGENKGSKIVFTTRNRDLIREMNAKQSMQIQPLLPEEAWELFSKLAFEDGHVPDDIENIARQVAEECKGLPLAIKVIASTMVGNTDVDDWNLALKQMRKVDLNFPITHPRIDRELYQPLRWSYDSLPNDNLKSCFLYCAMFEEDARILLNKLVQAWIAEGLVKTKEDAEYEYLFQTGYSYVKLLENRCLLRVVKVINELRIVLHDVIRDMAIHIGENEENCVLRAGQSLQHFPNIPASHNCKRISVCGNDITSLPAKDLRCPKLVSLILARNSYLKEIPEAFLLNFTSSLRVLDLWHLSIKSLPTSLWKLTKLECLIFTGTEIEEISEEIGNLSCLQFLNLDFCQNLQALPSQIGELQNLKSLDLRGCVNLRVMPHEITQLSNCQILHD